jgi:hypothetical protein
MGILDALIVVAVGVALTVAGLAAWSGAWNFWAMPGIPGYGVLPLLLLPAGVMCLSIGILAPLGDLAENALVALVLLPLFAGALAGAAITIPGFLVLLFWTPKHLPDRLRPRWLPPTWTPPENSFSTMSRPFLRRELREHRPAGPHWPSRLVEGPSGVAPPQPRYGFLALEDAAITWYDCTWDTPDCKESFTVTASEATHVELSERPPYRFLRAPLALRVTTPTSALQIEVSTGIPGRTTAIEAAITAAMRRP